MGVGPVAFLAHGHHGVVQPALAVVVQPPEQRRPADEEEQQHERDGAEHRFH
jgi:hypothetical protein